MMRDQAILGVLAGSVISLILAGVLVSLRVRAITATRRTSRRR